MWVAGVGGRPLAPRAQVGEEDRCRACPTGQNSCPLSKGLRHGHWNFRCVGFCCSVRVCLGGHAAHRGFGFPHRTHIVLPDGLNSVFYIFSFLLMFTDESQA